MRIKKENDTTIKYSLLHKYYTWYLDIKSFSTYYISDENLKKIKEI